MYIYKVLERADALEPNQFDDSEKISWLDELGAMLKSEYKKEYTEYQVEYDENSGFTLPEGVTMDDVKRIYVRGVQVPKLSVLDAPDRRAKRFYKNLARQGDKIKVVYQEQYEPISDARTDKTLCPAPHDEMYVSWLIAKICFYNRDTDGYNQHLGLFNQKLLTYRNSLKDGGAVDKNAQLKGWW